MSGPFAVIFQRRATREIETADEWWRKNRPSSPDLFLTEFERMFAAVVLMPTLGTPAKSKRAAGVRRVLLRRTRYHVYYRGPGGGRRGARRMARGSGNRPGAVGGYRRRQPARSMVGEEIALCSSDLSVIQPHPFPGKLTFEEANELRRLRRGGAQLAELAERYKIAKASASAIIHFHSHIPVGLLRIHLLEPDRDLLDSLRRTERSRSKMWPPKFLLKHSAAASGELQSSEAWAGPTY